jgi:hypothetical protein
MAGRGKQGWADAKSKAQKVLGKDGKLPKPRVDIEGAMDAAGKLVVEVDKARDVLATKIGAATEGFAKVTNAAKLYDNMIGGSDFGLDPKKPDDKKQITAAQTILSDQLDEIRKLGDQFTKILNDLDKSLESIEKQINAAT